VTDFLKNDCTSPQTFSNNGPNVVCLMIHHSFDKLITALRSAWAREGVLDKEVTSHDDCLDAFKLALRPFKEQSTMQ
jgi:hypothetical protein